MRLPYTFQVKEFTDFLDSYWRIYGQDMRDLYVFFDTAKSAMECGADSLGYSSSYLGSICKGMSIEPLVSGLVGRFSLVVYVGSLSIDVVELGTLSRTLMEINGGLLKWAELPDFTPVVVKDVNPVPVLEVPPKLVVEVVDTSFEDPTPAVVEPLVDDFQLNDGQQKAFDKIRDYFTNSSIPNLVLGGYSGTGKSFLMKKLCTTLGASNFYFTAPTNKATKVLGRMLKPYGATCKTIYSLLGLRMEAVEDEIQLTYPTMEATLDAHIVVDEAGMLNKEVKTYLEYRASTSGVKVLYVGDPAQLNPIGEETSPIWTMPNQILLTEVVRYDNQILNLATYLRKQVFAEVPKVKLESDNNGHEGVWAKDHTGFLYLIDKLASQGNFSEIDSVKAIAWRNKVVGKLNDRIRYNIFDAGDLSRSKYLVGDRIMVASPVIGDSGEILATIDEEGTVSHAEIETDGQTNLQCYRLVVDLDDSDPLTLRCIHEDSELELDILLQKRATAARQPKKGFLWKDFWQLRNRFHQVRFSYAITAHRAQGSTYKYALVDSRDILSNTYAVEALRCLYVACTRPTTRLVIKR